LRLTGLGPVSLKPSRAYLFAEAAALTLRDPLPEQHSRFYVSSAGLGFRAAGTAGWLANLDFALPLRSTPYTGRGQPRLLFRLAYDF